jgi:hypothetical protein
MGLLMETRGDLVSEGQINEGLTVSLVMVVVLSTVLFLKYGFQGHSNT